MRAPRDVELQRLTRSPVQESSTAVKELSTSHPIWLVRAQHGDGRLQSAAAVVRFQAALCTLALPLPYREPPPTSSCSAHPQARKPVGSVSILAHADIPTISARPPQAPVVWSDACSSHDDAATCFI